MSDFFHYSAEAEERMQKFSERFDALLQVVNFILGGRSAVLSVETLGSVLSPEELRSLQEVSTDRKEVLNRLHELILDMTEDS
jgi:hypothetical protein